MKLIVLHQVQKHINYLLNRFKGTEWSGPAFYSCKTDEHGFPEEWTLEGIVPLDLGSTAATEWDGEDFIKVRKDIYKIHPEYEKCYLGLIHSHHELNAGAYFSGTDTNQLEEAANKVGYPSLVVSTISGKTHAFAIAYQDNFNQIHVIEADNIVIRQPKVKVEAEWQKWANRIKKQANSKPKHMWHNARNGNQLSLGSYGGYIGYNQSPKAEKKKQKKIDMLEAKYDKVEAHYDRIRVQFANGKASHEQVEKVSDKLRDIGNDLFKLTGAHQPMLGGEYYGF